MPVYAQATHLWHPSVPLPYARALSHTHPSHSPPLRQQSLARPAPRGVEVHHPQLIRLPPLDQLGEGVGGQGHHHRVDQVLWRGQVDLVDPGKGVGRNSESKRPVPFPWILSKHSDSLSQKNVNHDGLTQRCRQDQDKNTIVDIQTHIDGQRQKLHPNVFHDPES